MWRIEGHLAQWQSGQLEAALDTSRPDLGLSRIRCGSARLEGLSVLQMHLVSSSSDECRPVEDCYVRGPDLIVTYAATEARPTRPQVYWRVIDEPAVADIVMLQGIISNQTETRDIDPSVCASCDVPGATWLCHENRESPEESSKYCFRPVSMEHPFRVPIPVPPGGCALLARLADSEWTFGQILLPSDLTRAELIGNRSDRTSRICLELFADRLEKGVLRRVRASTILVDRRRDESVIGDYLRQMARTAPPLTT